MRLELLIRVINPNIRCIICDIGDHTIYIGKISDCPEKLLNKNVLKIDTDSIFTHHIIEIFSIKLDMEVNNV